MNKDQKRMMWLRRNRLLRLTDIPSDPIAVFIQPCFKFDHGHRAIAAVLHIFFARPLQAHRRAGYRHRDHHRLLGIFLRDAAPSKATTGVHFMDNYFLQRNAGRLRRRSDGRFTILCADPNFQAIGVD